MREFQHLENFNKSEKYMKLCKKKLPCLQLYVLYFLNIIIDAQPPYKPATMSYGALLQKVTFLL